MTLMPWAWLVLAMTACSLLWVRRRKNLLALDLWLPRFHQPKMGLPTFLFQECWLILSILCFGLAFWLEAAKSTGVSSHIENPVLAWMTWVPVGETGSLVGLQQQSLILGTNRELERVAERPLVAVFPCGDLPRPFCPPTTDYSFISWMFFAGEKQVAKSSGLLSGEELAMKSLTGVGSGQKHILLVFPNAQAARKHLAKVDVLLSLAAGLPQMILLEDGSVPADLQASFSGKIRPMGGRVISDGMAGQFLQLNLPGIAGKIVAGSAFGNSSWWIAAGVVFMGASCLRHGEFRWKAKAPMVEAET